MKANDKADSKKTVKVTTTNYPMDSHKAFCKRCMKINGCCPMTGSDRASKNCDI